MSIQLRNIQASHTPGEMVLKSVNLEVNKGELLAVLGPSGSGKTTLLRVIAGLHRADAGSVLVHGEDVTDLKPEVRRIGLVPQDGALFPHLSVAANIAFGIRGPRTAKRATRHPRVRELLATVRLENLADRMPHELSGGQQQRVALARALAPSPDLVLLDEPFSALDASLRQMVRMEVADILSANQITTILITHDQDEALSMGNRIALLNEGQVVQSGTPHEIYARPRNLWAANFVGEANILPGTLEANRVRTVLGSHTHQGRQGTGIATVLIRPEQLRLEDSGQAHGLHAVVTRQQYFGHDHLIELEVAGESRTKLVSRTSRLWEPGQKVTFTIDEPVHVID